MEKGPWGERFRGASSPNSPELLWLSFLLLAQSWQIEWLLGGRGGLQLPKTVNMEESSHREKGKPT